MLVSAHCVRLCPACYPSALDVEKPSSSGDDRVAAARCFVMAYGVNTEFVASTEITC